MLLPSFHRLFCDLVAEVLSGNILYLFSNLPSLCLLRYAFTPAKHIWIMDVFEPRMITAGETTIRLSRIAQMRINHSAEMYWVESGVDENTGFSEYLRWIGAPKVHTS
jgi:hypothetical protein